MKPLWVATLAVIFLVIPTAQAIQPPDVTFIPSQISVNSSFILIADPHASTGESVSVKWVVFGIENGYGSIPFTGTRYVCYFSDIDLQNTCGPNMFKYPSMGVPYEMQINASNQYGQTETSLLNVSIGGIPIRSEIATTGNSVYIKAWAGNPIEGAISYKVYDSAGLNMVKSGTMTKNDMIFGYTTNITLSNGEYYIAFTATSSTDFGGGVSRVVVGGSSGSTDVQADSIAYSPVISPNQPFTIETFRITNIGTGNLTDLSISVPSQISSYLTITPKKTLLEPNESTYMTVSIHNIQSSTNISTFATLLSGSTEIKEIPVELRISVIGGINPESCVGKGDLELCLGGKCCGGQCITVAIECCGTIGCSSGEICSNYKCTTSPINTTDISCSEGTCRTACYSDEEETGYTCMESGIEGICCTQSPQQGECEGKEEGASCSAGFCCSGLCEECCTDDNCDTLAGETCSYGVCTTGTVTPGGGIDLTTIALIGGGVAAAAVVGFVVFKKFIKKKNKDEGEEDFEEGGEKEDDEFSDEDFY